MEIQETRIPGLFILEDDNFSDSRGSFRRKYCVKDLKELLKERNIVQVNQSDNILAGTIRGLHYQIEESKEIKIVSCVQGSALDIAVDLRKGSKTFLQYESLLITAENHRSFFIPEGFAHGFQTLEDHTSLIYFTTQFYCPVNESGINYLEPSVGIKWNLPASVLSLKDQQIPLLNVNFKGI